MLHRTYPHLSAEERAVFMTEMRNEFIALAPDHITCNHMRRRCWASSGNRA